MAHPLGPARVAMALDDDIRNERQERSRAAQDAELATNRGRIERQWLTSRPWASPNDWLLEPPPSEYVVLVGEILESIPRPLWATGYVYSDAFGRQRLAQSVTIPVPVVSGTESSDFFQRRSARRQLRREQARTDSLNRALSGQIRAETREVAYLAHNNSYSTYDGYGSDFVRATWSFAVVEDGTVGATARPGIFGAPSEIRQFLVKLVVDGTSR